MKSGCTISLVLGSLNLETVVKVICYINFHAFICLKSIFLFLVLFHSFSPGSLSSSSLIICHKGGALIAIFFSSVHSGAIWQSHVKETERHCKWDKAPTMFLPTVQTIFIIACTTWCNILFHDICNYPYMLLNFSPLFSYSAACDCAKRGIRQVSLRQNSLLKSLLRYIWVPLKTIKFYRNENDLWNYGDLEKSRNWNLIICEC